MLLNDGTSSSIVVCVCVFVCVCVCVCVCVRTSVDAVVTWLMRLLPGNGSSHKGTRMGRVADLKSKTSNKWRFVRAMVYSVYTRVCVCSTYCLLSVVCCLLIGRVSGVGEDSGPASKGCTGRHA